MKSTLSIALVTALALTPAGAFAQERPQARQQAQRAATLNEGVAAVVNDQVISTYDVRQRATLLLASAGMQMTEETMQRAAQQALRDLVDERLQLQEATRYEITVTDEQINNSVGDIARQNNTTAEQLSRQLSSSGINPQTLRNQIEADIAWRRLIGGRYGTRVRISPTEIAETQARIAQSATRAQYQVSEIFLPAESEAEFTEMTNGATRLLQEMQRGAPFPLVARQFSAAPSAAAGGDLGWVTASEVRPELVAALERLTAGQVSTPIRTPVGIYLVALRDKRSGVEGATSMRLGLLQVKAPRSSQRAMERAAARVAGCERLADFISSVSGADVTDLGTTDESDLSDDIRAQVSGVERGRASRVTVTGDEASFMVVCTRESAAEGVPTRDEIENRLYEQELAMLSQRYLRDLRREATIITR